MHRRDVVKMGAGLAGVSLLGLAGCLHSSDEPDGEAALEWLPAPELLGEEIEFYRVLSTTPATVEEYSDRLSEATWTQYQMAWLDWEVANPDPGDVDRMVIGREREHQFNVAEHNLDADDLRYSLEEDGFGQDNTYEGYDIFTRSDGQDARAVSDDALLSAEAPADATQILEAVIDSKAGSVDRYHEVNGDFAAAVDQLDLRYNYRAQSYQEITETQSQLGVFQGSIGRGQASTFGDDSISVTRLEVMVEDTDITQGEIDHFIEENPLFDHAENLETDVHGNIFLFEFDVEWDQGNLDQVG